ncbi:M4 family metallopeptidase [Aurantimonas sp. HBX-1]|uniref:M4 family metallopeptidase n=1 Tax=Aurantimonas sp. HBX-1 TaxID=2906072 RepID=UPI001F46E8CD|nr:M4 family metallopeptidase [Aurantimonas sp. HBX-1]UIJ70332.1 M4 family metallopeptidase [Aurantimonas sp. HBX-1]
MAGFEKIHFSLSGDSASGQQTRLRRLTRDAGFGRLQGFTVESAESTDNRPPPSPETASRLYLQTYLTDAGSEALAQISTPDSPALAPDLRLVTSSRTEQLFAQTLVYEQTWKSIPVFGGRVVVDVDQADRSLVSINGQLAPPPTKSPVASLSAQDAAGRASGWAASGTVPADEAPLLTWYYLEPDNGGAPAGDWRLVWRFRSVPLVPPAEPAAAPPPDHDHRFCLGPSPRSRAALIDVFVDAQDGEVVYHFPSTPALAIPIAMTGDDVDGLSRNFFGLQTPTGFALSDPLRNIVTFDYSLQDIDRTPPPPLPPSPINHSSQHLGSAHRAAVSAHHNATNVFNFFNDVLKRDGVDDKGMQLVSIVNVWSSRGGDPSPQWRNAVWWNKRMWYGQSGGHSLARYLDVIGHELTHGVTESTADLVYRDLPGALNESYSDIFGVIIANWYPNEPEPIGSWNWQIGAGLGAGGGPLRDFADPSATGQPNHFSSYVAWPYSRDYGGVHYYSGIHNKAVHNLLTGADAAGNPTFPVREAALMLYLTLTRLTQTSDFADSRRTLEAVTRAHYSGDPAKLAIRLAAIASAFGTVGL